MRKLKLRKDLRLASIIICVTLMFILAGFTFVEFKNPGVIEKKVPSYSYEIKDNINYKVFLKPNSLYDTDSVGEDQVYLANLVDYIDTTFTYEFKGEREAVTKGNYNIIAIVEGYTGEEDKLTTIWKKQFPLIENTPFESREKSVEISRNIPLRLNSYSDFAEKIKKETGITTQAKISVVMNVELNALTDKGLIDKKSITAFEAPLSSSYFKISKKLTENKPEAIEELRTVQQPIKKKILIGYGSGFGMVLIILLFLLFGTQKVEVDPFVKELKKIFKKHGTRLVAFETEIAATSEHQCRVHSIDDLVRISDELGKPIVYKYSNNDKENSLFWVIDENRYYVFDLKESSCYENSQNKKIKFSFGNNKDNGISPNEEAGHSNSIENMPHQTPLFQDEFRKSDESKIDTWEKK